MNLHEYQARQLLTDYGIAVPSGGLAYSAEEACKHAQAQPNSQGWVIKAQVHAGGRGKAGGVKLVQTIDNVKAAASAMLGSSLVTKQSYPHGQPVHCVLVQAAVEIRRELYLGMLVDRNSKSVSIMASSAGGMDIEAVATQNPERIVNVSIDPLITIQGYHVRNIADHLSLDNEQQRQFSSLLHNLYRLFLDKDLSLIEINPLVIDDKNKLLCLDAKFAVDDNALYRQSELKACYDITQEDENEVLARQHDLSYVKLDGNIACIVNGAGLAMATMDIIKLYGGEPANFLDVGGDTTPDKVAEAFKLILANANVQAILVNIFGGIVRCDLIAQGIIKAVAEVGVHVPVVIRLEGTNAMQGMEILTQSKLKIMTAEDLVDAAKKVVGVTKQDS